MTYRYLPILRTKAGEVTAISNLSAHAKSRIFPLIRATATIPATFLPGMIANCAGLQMSLDGEHNFLATGSLTGFTTLFNGLGSGGIPVIPAVSFDSNATYLSAAIGEMNKFASGIVVRVSIADLPRMISWCASVGLHKNDVNLVVMLGDVSEHDVISFSNYVRHELTRNITTPLPWKSLAIYSYSAAKDHGGFPRGRSLAPRNCWRIWNNIVANQLPFQLDYADCGHIHPSLEEVPGYAMANATVSVRYTINDNWVIIKGSPTRGANGSPMSVQYRAHARALVLENEFNNLSYCWGDDGIRAYSTTTGGTGGRSQWVSILLNRHLSHVCDRLP